MALSIIDILDILVVILWVIVCKFENHTVKEDKEIPKIYFCLNQVI